MSATLPPHSIADIALAPAGDVKIEWAARHSPVLNHLSKTTLAPGSLKGVRIGMAIHLEAKTAWLACILNNAGAEVTVGGSNPVSTQDDICAALVRRGIGVFAHHGAGANQFDADAVGVIGQAPDVLIDDGAALGRRLLTHRPETMQRLRGISEETTTGRVRYSAMQAEGRLGCPVFIANDAQCKHLFDNRFGTGHSSLAAILAKTNRFVTGSRVGVVGFGWVGRGIARYFAGMGARVIVSEPDPVKLLEAWAEGHEVADTRGLAQAADIIVTTTGGLHAIGRQHIDALRDGVVLSNAGHSAEEVDLSALAELAVQRSSVRDGVEGYRLADGRTIFVIEGAEQVNVARFDGHPIEVMDLTFAVQALSAHHLAHNGARLRPGVQPLPAAIDHQVALAKLASLGCTPEALSPEQVDYFKQWADVA